MSRQSGRGKSANPATAIPNAESQVQAYGRMLAVSEWLSPQEIEASQAKLACKLLLHARGTTTFYKDRLGGDLDAPATVRKLWSDIPILTRAEAVKNRLKLMSRRPGREMGPVSEGRTSGSAGAPFVFKKNAASDIVATALTERMFRWWSIDGRKSFAQIASDATGQAPAPDGRITYGWHSGHPGGIKYLIGVNTDADTHLRWLTACRAAYFGSYPAILKELAGAAQKQGIDIKLEQLLSFAAALDDETRQLCRTAFGAEIADTYGTQEAGHIAAQCRDCGDYHVSAESAIVEVLRNDGTAAAPGEIGRVVVTPFYSYAMPLIRYELGDLAEAGPVPARCGRGLPTLRRILGRARNMFRFRDGSTIWPVTSAFRLSAFIALKQFQVVQTDFERIEIRFVPEASDRPVDLVGLTQRMRTVLRQPVEVVVRAVDRIERSANGKYEECISLVSPDAQPVPPSKRLVV
jgi:phenylacetate-CoA ligase